MIAAGVILALAVAGVLPYPVALPLAVVAGVTTHGAGFLFQRRVMRSPPLVGREAMIGATAEALTVVGETGSILYHNEIWKARAVSSDIRVGARVRIVRLEGLLALVEATPLETGGGE